MTVYCHENWFIFIQTKFLKFEELTVWHIKYACYVGQARTLDAHWETNIIKLYFSDYFQLSIVIWDQKYI